VQSCGDAEKDDKANKEKSRQKDACKREDFSQATARIVRESYKGPLDSW
jgi:hypothetical protein